MGFPTGISGADLCARGEIQALKFGTRFAVPRRVTSARAARGGFELTLDDGVTVEAGAVVVATGVQYRRLPLDRLEQFEGAGVCTPRLSSKPGTSRAAVRSSSAAATRPARRRCSLAAGPLTCISWCAAPRLRLRCQTTWSSASAGTLPLPSTSRRRLRRSTATPLLKASHSPPQQICGGAVLAAGLFIMAGAAPNTAWLADLVALDAKGFVLTRGWLRDIASGCLRCRDVRAGSTKRVASAVGEGSVVISKDWAHLSDGRA